MKQKLFRTTLVAAALTTALAQGALPGVAAAATGSQRVGIAASTVSDESEVTVTVDALNVRQSPNLQGQIVGRLTGGTKLTPLGKSADGAWWKITYNGAEAYIYAEYAVAGGSYGGATTTTSDGGGSSVRVTTDYLNVRAGPGLGNEVIGQLQGGATVDTSGKSADGAWWQISFNGSEAYIYAAYTTSASGAAPAAAAPAAKGGASMNGFEVGAHIRGTDYLGQMKDVGMGWVKYQVVIGGGAPDLSGIIGAVHNAGLKILVGAVGERWRAADTGYHREFAGYLANLASQGADAIEVWNEPNLDREYGGSGNGQVNPENYANMLREAYGAIKAANGGTLVISGAPAPTGYKGGGCDNEICDDQPFLQRLAATGAAAWMDCIGAHHNGSPNAPDTRSGGPTGEHASWYFWGTLDVSYGAFGGRRPVCWTELGYVTGEGIGALPGDFSWGSHITLDNQAQWLARAAQLSRDSGKVRLMIIWNADFRQFDNDPQAGYSIFRPNGECRACNTLRAVLQ